MQLEVFLKRALKKYRVPGASLAVMRNDALVLEAQAGIVNIDSRLKVTRDAVFQIGSIAKPMTATLVMQLVEEGLVSLDNRLDNYLPGWNRSSATIRQILSHSSGVEGDFFIDTGLGDDAIRRYVDKCTMVPSLFPPGELMSYCNLGYAVLGRLLEVIRGKPFDAIIQSYLFDPLRMNHAFVTPNKSIRINCFEGRKE